MMMVKKKPNNKIIQFCRDCYNQSKEISNKCEICFSPRIIQHNEISNLEIAHIDCDAFYASVEKRDNPKLKNKPVIIGGGNRGVVSTACYIARIKGIHSAMPIYKAKKLCPEAIIISPNIKKYRIVSNQIRDLMKELTPIIEPISLDEAFLDLKGTYRLHKKIPAILLAKLVNKIENELNITASVGLSFNKYLAKVCSDLDKPKGFSVLGKNEAHFFLKDKPVNLLWGVGSKFKTKLNSDGIINIGQIQKMDEKELIKRYGVMGLHISQLSKGKDSRAVKANRQIKSISHEITFSKNIKNKKELEDILVNLSQKIAFRAKSSELGGKTINLKLKTKDFKLISRSKTISQPTQLERIIYKVAKELLYNEKNNYEYRLIGLGISELKEERFCDLGDLIDLKYNNEKNIDTAINSLRAKFGDNIIERGKNYAKHRRKSKKT